MIPCPVTTRLFTGMQIRTFWPLANGIGEFVVAMLLKKSKNYSDSTRLRKHAPIHAQREYKMGV